MELVHRRLLVRPFVIMPQDPSDYFPWLELFKPTQKSPNLKGHSVPMLKRVCCLMSRGRKWAQAYSCFLFTLYCLVPVRKRSCSEPHGKLESSRDLGFEKSQLILVQLIVNPFQAPVLFVYFV